MTGLCNKYVLLLSVTQGQSVEKNSLGDYQRTKNKIWELNCLARPEAVTGSSSCARFWPTWTESAPLLVLSANGTEDPAVGPWDVEELIDGRGRG